MAQKVAVVLCGCGHKDGSEITEAVSVFIALTELGAEYKVFAPDTRFSVVDPITSQPMSESRFILKEAARLSRGKIQDVYELQTKDFDAVVFPGGAGVAAYLCTWAKDGAHCTVHPEVERILKEFYKERKAICAICISPVLIARVLGREGVTVTIGNDPKTASEIIKTGAHHEGCSVDACVCDLTHRIVTTPAYMHANARSCDVFAGIRTAIRELIALVGEDRK